MTYVTSLFTSRNVAAAALLAGALAFSACSGSRETADRDTRTPVDVAVQPATLESGAQLFDVGGQVRARTTATLVSKLFAEVQEILVQPGDKVRAGQVLVRLDSRDLQAQRAQAEAGVAAAEQGVKAATTNRDAAEAGLALAAATHKRIAELRAKNSATPNELDQAVSALKAAESHAAGRAGRHPAGRGRRRSGSRRPAGRDRRRLVRRHHRPLRRHRHREAGRGRQHGDARHVRC